MVARERGTRERGQRPIPVSHHPASLASRYTLQLGGGDSFPRSLLAGRGGGTATHTGATRMGPAPVALGVGKAACLELSSLGPNLSGINRLLHIDLVLANCRTDHDTWRVTSLTPGSRCHTYDSSANSQNY